MKPRKTEKKPPMGVCQNRHFLVYRGLTAVKLNTSAFTLNNEQRDAFYGAITFTKTAQEVLLPKQVLKHALGKLVLREKSKAVYEQSTTLSVAYTVPSTFNTATGVATGTYAMSATDLPLAGNATTDDLTLFFDYIFTTTGEVGYALPEFTLRGKNSINSEEYLKTIPANVPVKQNKRTILSGTNMLIAPLAEGDKVTVDTEIFEQWDDDVTVDGDIPQPEKAAFAGTGTADALYEIATVADLVTLMKLVNDAKAFAELPYAEAVYRQTAALTFGVEKIGIGTATSPFKGVYNGEGQPINGFIATQEGTAYTAMFGVVDGATLTNIRAMSLKNMTKNGNLAGAGICALSRGETTITNTHCEVSNITCGGSAVAAICAQVESGTLTLNSCKVTSLSTSNVLKTDGTGSNYLSGIIGYVAPGATATVVDCYSTVKLVQAAIPAAGTFQMGGICGKADGTLTVSRSYVTGAFGFLEGSLSGAITGTDSDTGVTDCFYLIGGGAKVQPSFFNGAKKMAANAWPAWDVDTSGWKALGNLALPLSIPPSTGSKAVRIFSLPF